MEKINSDAAVARTAVQDKEHTTVNVLAEHNTDRITDELDDSGEPRWRVRLFFSETTFKLFVVCKYKRLPLKNSLILFSVVLLLSSHGSMDHEHGHSKLVCVRFRSCQYRVSR